MSLLAEYADPPLWNGEERGSEGGSAYCGNSSLASSDLRWMAGVATAIEYYIRERFGVNFAHIRSILLGYGAQSSATEDHFDMPSETEGARGPIDDRGGMGVYREHLCLATSGRL